MAFINYSKQDLALLFDFYGNKCLACGSTQISVDHVVPASCGGKDTLDNIQPLCPSCNASKHNYSFDYRTVLYPGKSSVEPTGMVVLISEFATKKGLSYSQFRRHLESTGVSVGTIRQYWMGNNSSLNLDILNTICALLDCSPGELIQRVTD